MRRPNARIDVTTTMDQAYGKPRPVSFRYAGQLIRVAQVWDCWRMAGEWWEQKPESVTWRVEDVRGGRYELEMEETTPPKWWLRVVYD